MTHFEYTSENSDKAPAGEVDARAIVTEFLVQKGMAGHSQDEIFPDSKLAARAGWYAQHLPNSKWDKIVGFLEDSKDAFKNLVHDGAANSAGISYNDIREFERRAKDAGKPGVAELPADIIKAMQKANLSDQVAGLRDPNNFKAAVLANFEIIDENKNDSLEPAEVAGAGHRSEEGSVLGTICDVMRMEYRALSEIADKPYELTRRDFSLLTGYQPGETVPPAKLNPELGVKVVAGGSAITATLAIAAVVDPEPVTKCVLGGAAAITGIYTALAGVNTAGAAVEDQRHKASLSRPSVYPYKSIDYFRKK